MINPLDVIGNSSGEVYVVDQNGDGVIEATPYNPDNPSEPFQFRKQLGFLPLFYYKIEFKLAGKKHINLPLEND